MANEAEVVLSPQSKAGELIGPFPEAATQSYKRGHFVYLDAGTVKISADAASFKTIGIAQSDASGVTARAAYIHPIKPGDEVAVTCSAAPTAAGLGIGYGIAAVSTTHHNVDLADTTNKVVSLKRLIYKPDGGISTRAIVQFFENKLQYHIGFSE